MGEVDPETLLEWLQSGAGKLGIGSSFPGSRMAEAGPKTLLKWLQSVAGKLGIG